MRRAALLAFALALAAVPAAAQTDAEVIGSYRVTVEPAPGSVCPPGQATFEVLRVGGRLMEVSLDGTRTVADWNPETKSFAGTIPFPDGDHLVRLDGSFLRTSTQVKIVVHVEFPPNRPCEALLTGTIPLNAAAPPPPPPGPPTPPTPPLGTTTSSAPSVFGVAPNGQPVDISAYQPPPQRVLKDAGLLGFAALIALLAGLVIGITRGKAKRRKAAPAPAAPKPEPEPAAAPPPAPKAKAPRERSPVSRAARPPAKPRPTKPKPPPTTPKS